MMLLSFNNPSKATTDSLFTIQHKEEQLLSALRANSDNAALSAFVTACNNSIAPNNENHNIGNGDPIDGESLEIVNVALNAAVSKLNSDMSADSTWKPLVFTNLTPTLFGSVKFQVLQLETQAYVNAIE
jgi:hypothetical protein